MANDDAFRAALKRIDHPEARLFDDRLKNIKMDRARRIIVMRVAILLFPKSTVFNIQLAEIVYKNYRHDNILYSRRLLNHVRKIDPLNYFSMRNVFELETSFEHGIPMGRHVRDSLLAHPSSAYFNQATGRLAIHHGFGSWAPHFLNRCRVFGALSVETWANRFRIKIQTENVDGAVLDLRRMMIVAPSSLAGEAEAYRHRRSWSQMHGLAGASARFKRLGGVGSVSALDKLGIDREASQDVPKAIYQRLIILVKSAPRYKVKNADVSLLTGLAWSGRFDQAYMLIRRLRKNADMTYSVRMRMAVTELVCLLVIRNPTLVFSAGNGHRSVLSVPVWGRSHAEFWVNIAARSLLAPRNRAVLAKGAKCLVIYADRAALKVIMNHPTILALSEIVAIKAINLFSELPATDCAISQRDRVAAAQWSAMIMARDANANFVNLAPDGLYADGSLETIEAKAKYHGREALFSSDYEVGANFENFHDINALNSNIDFDWPHLLFIHQEAMSKRQKANMAVRDGIYLNSNTPGNFMVATSGDYREAINLQPNLYFCSNTALRRIWPFLRFVTLDSGLIEMIRAVFEKDEFYEIMNKMEEFMSLVVQPGDEPPNVWPVDIKDLDQGASRLAMAIRAVGLNTPGRMKAFSAPYILSPEIPERPAEIEQFFQKVAQALDVPDDDGAGTLAKLMWGALPN